VNPVARKEEHYLSKGSPGGGDGIAVSQIVFAG
jgi:hypothetical protein